MRRWMLLLPVLGLLGWTAASDNQFERSFEGRSPEWMAGDADATFQELLHDVTQQTSRSGQQSEHLRLKAEQGTFIHYYLAVGRADLSEVFQASVWLKANRPGMQFMARVVLPRERDAKDLSKPMTTLLRGDLYQNVGRWQQLHIRDPLRVMREQQQLMRAELNRDLNFEGAYVDQVLLNVMGGIGLNEMWIDDVSVFPVANAMADDPRGIGRVTTQPKTLAADGGGARLTQPRATVIELSQDRLLVNRKPFFVRGVRYSGSSLKALREAGFNTLWIDANTPESTWMEASQLGFWLVPELNVLAPSADRANSLEIVASLGDRVSRFPAQDAILCWQTGTNLTQELTDLMPRAIRTVKNSDPYRGRPVAGSVWDGFAPYSRHLDMVGVHRWPLFTGLELIHYRDWLETRGHLTEPGIYLYTWIQAHTPEEIQARMADQPPAGAAAPDVQPHPEQIKLLSYLALSAGYRGMSFWLDRALTEQPVDRVRWLTLALLNQELSLLEPMLATLKDWQWYPNRHATEVHLSMMRFDGGVMVLPMWLSPGMQYVPAQASMSQLQLIIPGAPNDALAWEVTPVRVRPLAQTRVAGGTKVVLPEFGLATCIVFTSDFAQVGRLQQLVGQMNKQAAQWSYELAVLRVNEVEKIHKELEQMGHPQSSSVSLLADARKHLYAAQEALQRGGVTDFATAYEESQRALRPLRKLMRLDWEHALRGVDHPVSSPFTVAFQSLPQHWKMVREVRTSQTLPNLLPTGDFEWPTPQPPSDWVVQQVTLDEVRLRLDRAAEDPKQGRQCLKLEIVPNDVAARPAALERTFLAYHSPKVNLKPGMLVRISGWIKIPKPIEASRDGVLFFDSIGGEALAVRLSAATGWRQFSLFRRVPESGQVGVTLALTGLGTVYFDDVRIEPLVSSQPPADAESQETNQSTGSNEP